MSRAYQLQSLCRQIFFPARACPACGALTPRPGPCPLCLKKITALPRCACLLPEAEESCPLCSRGEKPLLKGALAALPYEGLLRQNILQFKYEGKTYFARPFAALLAAAVAEFYSHRPWDILVPVPLCVQRQKERGYNQAQLCSTFLAPALGLLHAPKALSRIKETPPLAQHTREERRALMQGAFVADPAQIKGKKVLLMDDIFTTGATLISCSQALLKAGAAGVWGITLAYTPQKQGKATL